MKLSELLTLAVVLLLIAAPTLAATGSMQGDTAIVTNGNVAVIAVDIHMGATKGVADYAFVFASENVPPPISLLLPNAHLEFTDQRLTIISASTQSILTFALAGAPAEDRVIPPSFKVTNYVGYQLAWHDLRNRSITLDDVLDHASGLIHPNVNQTGDEFWDEINGGGGGGGTPPPTCRAGGRGSTQCSAEWEVQGATITYKRSCTVTCASGFYACCNDYSCKCYPNQ